MYSDGKKKSTWVQCQDCGEIFQIPYTISIDKLYVMTNCPNCGDAKALNLGNQKEDWYYFYNVNLDYRQY